MLEKHTYIFLDESGNFDFSSNGTQNFSLTCTTDERPFYLNHLLENYKYDCIEYGLQQEYFHCSEDNSHVRKRIFEFIENNFGSIYIDSLIIKKSKSDINFRDPNIFYSSLLGFLLDRIINLQNPIKNLVIITDSLPITKKRRAIEKSIKTTLADILPTDTSYQILHHSSKSHYGLQISDYCSWAIWRKWERNDLIHYNKIQKAIRSEYKTSFSVVREEILKRMTSSTTPTKVLLRREPLGLLSSRRNLYS